MRHLARCERGSVLVAVVIMVTIAASLGTAIYSFVATGSLTQIGSMNDTKAYYLAESGGYYGIKRLTASGVDLSVATVFNDLRDELDAQPFVITDAGQFSLQNFTKSSSGGFLEIRFESIGIPTDADISRKINYIVRVTDPAGTTIPFDGTGPNLNPDNWNANGPVSRDTTNPDNPTVTLGGTADSQISLDWGNTNSTMPKLDEVRKDANGLLTYEAQVKVKLSTNQDVLAGLSFRLNTGGNTNPADDSFYGLSYLWCESSSSGRDLPTFCGSNTSKTYIVLWKQASNGTKTMIGKRLASAVNPGLVSGNALVNWATLVVRLQEQFNLVTGLRENMIYAFVGTPDTSPLGTPHWDYTKYTAVSWDAASFNGTDCSGGQRYFVSDSTFTTENFDTLPQDEVGLHAFGRAQAGMADLALRFNFDGGVAETCVAGAPGTIALTAATSTTSEGGGTVTITAKRTAGSVGAVSVSYGITGGTATAGQDYTFTPGTLSWAEGDTANKSFTITINDDADFESSETIDVAISAPTGWALLGVPNTAVVTITDNDGISTCNAWPNTALKSGTTSLGTTYVAGSCANRLLVCAVTSELWASSSSFTVAGSYGGSNFTLLKSTNGLYTRQHVWLGYVNDSGITDRGDDTISLAVSGGALPSGSNLYCATYQGVDQTTPVAGSRANTNSGSSTVSFGGNVAVSQGGVIFYALAANGARSTPPSGYLEHWDQSLSGYSQSGGSKSITATGSENRSWSLSSGDRWGLAVGSLNPGAGGGSPGTIAFTDATYSQDEDGGSATITVSRMGGSTGAVAVDYATMNGTATTAGADYTASSGTLSWGDGDAAAKSFTVTILDDADYEGDETVNLSLANVSGGATLDTPNTAELTIVDNETPPAASRYDLTYDAAAPSMGVDGAIDALAQTTYYYTSSANQNRAPLKTGVTLGGTQGRYRYGNGFSGSNYEMARAYTPTYTSANGKILANVEVSVDYYVRTSGGTTGTLTAQLYEYNDSSGVVGSAKGTWTSAPFATTSTGNAITLTGTINNPTFTVSAGNRLEVRFLTTQTGGEVALLYGAYKSGTEGNSFISVVEMAAGPDTTPPVVSGVTVTPSSGTYTLASPTITATLTDAESQVTACEYTTNGSTWTAGVVSGAASPWTCTGSPSALSGSLTINARATSTGGVGTGTAVTRTVDSTAPIHSGSFTATATGPTQINLNWPTATDAQAGMRASNRYKLVRATGATAPVDCSSTAIYSGTSTTYSNTGLTANTQYTYRLCAYDAVDNATSGLTATAMTPTASTYNFQSNSGTQVASGVTTNASSCGTTSMNAVVRTLMDKNPHGCSSQRVVKSSTGAGDMLYAYVNTPYSSSTVVTGTSLKIRLRNGSFNSWTAGIRLLHIAAGGTITNFTGSEVLQTVSGGGDQDYTLSLSGQTATVPVGSKLGILIRATTGSSNDMRLYYGSQANTSGSGTSGVLTVNEAAAAADITPPTVGAVTVNPISGAYITATPTITASLADLESVVTACEYTTDGSTWVAGVKSGSASPWTCSASPTGLSGARTINMRGTSTGGVGTGTPVVLTVDASGPANGVLTVTPGNSQNSLAWTAATDAASGLRASNTYDVRFLTGATAPTCTSGSSIYTGTGLSVTHNSLNNGTQYSYRVCSYDALNNVSTGATGSGTPGDNTPPLIGAVTVALTSGSYTSGAPMITASLTDAESVVTACEYTTNGSTWLAGAKSGTGSPWTCTGSPSGLSGALTINVRATSTGGTGSGTSVSRTVDATAPTFSGVLTATVVGSTQINLSWPAATDAASGLHTTLPYKVARATGVTAPADCTGTAIYSGTATSFNDTGLNPNSQYAYRVCAYDLVNNVSTGLTGSATTQAGSSAITVASQWQALASGSSATYTAGAGSNRLVLIAVHYEYGSTTLPTVTATYGGNSVTQINRSNNGRNDVWLGYVKEASIPAGAGTISVSFNNTPSARTISAATYANVDQGTPTLASTLGTTPTSGNSDSNPAFSGLSVSSGGYVVMVDTNNGNSTSPAANYTEHYDQSDGASAFRLYAASRAMTSAGTEGATFTMSSTRFGMVAVSLKPSAGGGDTTPPTHSGSLTATAVSSSQINLSWPTATDAGAGMHATQPYKLVRATGATPPADCSGTAIYSGTATSYNNTGRSASTQYSYRLCAYDAAGNVTTGLTASATTPAPPIVSVASQWQALASGSSATYTAGAGSNRLVLIAVHYEYGSTTLPTVTATYGGNSVTQINRSNNGRNDVWLGYVKEASIPAGAGTISVSFNNTPADRTISAATYANVDQGTPTLASTLGTTPTSGNSGSNPAFSGLSVSSGGYVVMVDTNNGNSTSPAANYTEHYDQSDGSSVFRLYAASRAITSAGTEGATFTMSSTRFGMIAVSLQP